MISSTDTVESFPKTEEALEKRSNTGAAHWLLRISFLATIAVYARVITFDWVFDDYPQIVMNGWLRGWRHIPDFFTKHMWAFAYPKWPGKYYRPGFLMWLWGNFHLFGTTPGWWHAVAVIAHLVASALVYLLAKYLTRDRWLGALAAAIFVLHPVHIEAIAWISGATEILVTILVLSSLYFYLTSAKSYDAARFWISIALYALALSSKETAVVLPLLILVATWLENGSAAKTKVVFCVKSVLPFAVVTVFYLAARIIALEGFAHADQKVALGTQLLTMPSVIWFYLHQLVWPWDLSLFYDVELVTHLTIRNFWLPSFLVTLVLVPTLFLVRRRTELQFGLCLLVLSLLPVLAGIGMFQQHDYVHDRYLYLPSVGFAIMMAVGIRHLASKIGSNDRVVRHFQLAFAAALLFAFAAGTHVQLGQWDSDYSVFARGVEVAKENPLPRRYLGETLISLGRPWDAIQLFKQALARDPKSWLDSYCLGTTYLRMKDWGHAKHYLEIAIENQPTSTGRDPLPTHQLGWAELNMGNAAAAEVHFRDAIAIRSEGAGFHRALGVALQKQDRFQEAQAEFRIDDAVKAEYLKGQDFEGK